MIRCRWPAALLLAATTSAPPAAAQAALRTLGYPSAELPEPFSRVASVRELSDGRVIVVDGGEWTVRLVDLAKSSAVPLGRKGGGPGEYQRPSRLIPLAADTTILTDVELQRSLLILPDGTPGPLLFDGAAAARLPLEARLPNFADSRGHVYFTGRAVEMSDRGPVISDSVPVLRLHRTTYRLDTLAWVGTPAAALHIDREGSRIRSVEVERDPLPQFDGWVAGDDGLAVVRGKRQYRLDRVTADGKALVGPNVDYDPVPVTGVDKQTRPSWKAWPRVKPPFIVSPLAAPNGLVWVRRTTRAADHRGIYDLIGAGGTVTGQIVVPPGSRIVGFGPRSVYSIRKDADDLEYLQRHPLP